MKTRIMMTGVFTGALIVTLYLAPAYADTRDFCFNGPGTVVTGDTITFNGLTYRAVVGTDGNDTLSGFDDPTTSERDVIWSLAGNDVVSGGNGDDILCGISGADTLYGGPGDDSILGASESSFLYGGDGSDHLHGLGGADTMYGEGGDDYDRIFIASGDLAGMYGGAGNDWMSGGDGKDWVVGQNGDDTIYGDKGEDEIGGGPDYDVLDGGQNKDKCEGEVEHSCEAPLFPR